MDLVLRVCYFHIVFHIMILLRRISKCWLSYTSIHSTFSETRIVRNDTNIEFVTRLPLNQRRILIPMIITTKYLLRNLRESRVEVQKEQDTMKLRGTPAEPCAAPSQVRRHSVPDFVFCTSVVRRLCRQFSETVYSASFILMMSGRREGHDCILNYIK